MLVRVRVVIFSIRIFHHGLITAMFTWSPFTSCKSSHIYTYDTISLISSAVQRYGDKSFQTVFAVLARGDECEHKGLLRKIIVFLLSLPSEMRCGTRSSLAWENSTIARQSLTENGLSASDWNLRRLRNNMRCDTWSILVCGNQARQLLWGIWQCLFFSAETPFTGKVVFCSKTESLTIAWQELDNSLTIVRILLQDRDLENSDADSQNATNWYLPSFPTVTRYDTKSTFFCRVERVHSGQMTTFIHSR